MELLAKIVAFIVVLLMVFAVFGALESHDTNAINEFMSKSNRQVVNIERHVLTYGPFFLVDDSDRVYEVQYINEYNENKTAWVRFGLFTTWNNPDGSDLK
jgi:predicted RND superfamily exporter protein